MEGLSFRQGTLYMDDAGKGFLLINHNPMALQSLQIPGENGTFDCAAAVPLAIDDLIAIRKTGTLQDRGDIPREVFAQLLAAVLQQAKLSDNDRTLLEGLLQEYTHA